MHASFERASDRSLHNAPREAGYGIVRIDLFHPGTKTMSGLGRSLDGMEYELTANPTSPGYDYLAVGYDVPIFARWAHHAPVTLGQEAADMVSAWLAKYDPWPESMAPVHLAPIDRSF